MTGCAAQSRKQLNHAYKVTLQHRGFFVVVVVVVAFFQGDRHKYGGEGKKWVCQRLVCQKREFAARSSSCEL